MSGSHCKATAYAPNALISAPCGPISVAASSLLTLDSPVRKPQRPRPNVSCGYTPGMVPQSAGMAVAASGRAERPVAGTGSTARGLFALSPGVVVAELVRDDVVRSLAALAKTPDDRNTIVAALPELTA